MSDDREQLLRLLEDDLPETEARALRARLAAEPDLRARLDQVRALRQTLAAGRADSFAPYFSERVRRRLAPAPERGGALYESLRWGFARTALASLLVAGALGTFNALDYQSLGVAVSFVEAVFGLPSASLADALSYSGL